MGPRNSEARTPRIGQRFAGAYARWKEETKTQETPYMAFVIRGRKRLYAAMLGI